MLPGLSQKASHWEGPCWLCVVTVLKFWLMYWEGASHFHFSPGSQFCSWTRVKSWLNMPAVQGPWVLCYDASRVLEWVPGGRWYILGRWHRWRGQKQERRKRTVVRVPVRYDEGWREQCLWGGMKGSSFRDIHEKWKGFGSVIAGKKREEIFVPTKLLSHVLII